MQIRFAFAAVAPLVSLIAAACSGPTGDIDQATPTAAEEVGAPTSNTTEENPSPIDKGEAADASAPPSAPSEDGGLADGGDGGGTGDPPPPACGEAPAEPPSPPVTAAPSTTYPEIKHWEIPAANVVALTFDDGPKPVVTHRILDILKAEKIRATFFVSTRATSDLRSDPEARAAVARIVAEGHVLGNHTASHYDLRDASVDVEAQLRFVEEDVKLAAPCAPPLTLVRTPFGQPQLAGTAEEKARVLPILARHGVHVGWTIESLDYECASIGPTCIVDKVRRRLALGKRGPILMHDTYPVTADALPAVIAEVRARGLSFVTAEKLVRDKYGKTSAQLVAEWRDR